MSAWLSLAESFVSLVSRIVPVVDSKRELNENSVAPPGSFGSIMSAWQSSDDYRSVSSFEAKNLSHKLNEILVVRPDPVVDSRMDDQETSLSVQPSNETQLNEIMVAPPDPIVNSRRDDQETSSSVQPSNETQLNEILVAPPGSSGSSRENAKLTGRMKDLYEKVSGIFVLEKKGMGTYNYSVRLSRLASKRRWDSMWEQVGLNYIIKIKERANNSSRMFFFLVFTPNCEFGQN